MRSKKSATKKKTDHRSRPRNVVKLADRPDLRGPHRFNAYRTHRMAQLLDVSPETIWRWKKTGKLPKPAVQLPGGYHAWSEEQVAELLQQRQAGVR
jgi:predicted DNA-binding transcriptional regulator AlpA